jgi:Co/Zn/Cd efflux system component
MQQTTFKITKMDCPSEEQLIRMRLEDVSAIVSLSFNIPERKLIVVHTGNYDMIYNRLEGLQLQTSVMDSVALEHVPEFNSEGQNQRKLLWQVLLINVFFFALESVIGFLYGSMGLMADSLDMLADSIVYGLALFAVGAAMVRKKKIASTAGYLQLILAVLGLVEVIRRFIGFDGMANYQAMIVVSALACVGNGLCLYLLQQSKSKEAHMQASMIFTSNDVIVNLGVILAGVLVYVSQSNVPDLIIGVIVFGIVGRGAYKILNLSK